MRLKRIFWSLLAGLSLSLTGCPRNAGPPPAGPEPPPAEARPAQPEEEETAPPGNAEEADEEKPVPAPMYGAPVLMYGPPSQDQ